MQTFTTNGTTHIRLSGGAIAIPRNLNETHAKHVLAKYPAGTPGRRAKIIAALREESADQRARR